MKPRVFKLSSSFNDPWTVTWTPYPYRAEYKFFNTWNEAINYALNQALSLGRN